MVGCCSLERAPAAVDAALQCVIQMAAAPTLQVVNPLPFAAPLCPFDCCLKPPFCICAHSWQQNQLTLGPCPFFFAAVVPPFNCCLSRHGVPLRHAPGGRKAAIKGRHDGIKEKGTGGQGPTQKAVYSLLELCLDRSIHQYNLQSGVGGQMSFAAAHLSFVPPLLFLCAYALPPASHP